jgi:hypothetical protein
MLGALQAFSPPRRHGHQNGVNPWDIGLAIGGCRTRS